MTLEKHEKLEATLSLYKNYICNEVLATKFDVVEVLESGQNIALVDDVVVKMKVFLS